jgi:hypothetical protein
LQTRPGLQRQQISASTRFDAFARLFLLEEPLATAPGNIEFRRRLQPRRFSWTRRWYGDDSVDLPARLLQPILSAESNGGGRLDAGVGRESGEYEIFAPYSERGRAGKSVFCIPGGYSPSQEPYR